MDPSFRRDDELKPGKPYSPNHPATTPLASSTPCLDSAENVCTLTVSPNAPNSSLRTACNCCVCWPRPDRSHGFTRPLIRPAA